MYFWENNFFFWSYNKILNNIVCVYFLKVIFFGSMWYKFFCFFEMVLYFSYVLLFFFGIILMCCMVLFLISDVFGLNFEIWFLIMGLNLILGGWVLLMESFEWWIMFGIFELDICLFLYLYKWWFWVFLLVIRWICLYLL